MTEVALHLSGATTIYGRVEDLFIVLHSVTDPSDEDWTALLEDCKREFPKIRGVFVFTLGGGPNADQRRRLAEVYLANPRLALIAVVTPSPAVRAIVTGVSWFVKNPFRQFSPDEIDEAFKYLRTTTSEQVAIKRLLHQNAPWLGLSGLAQRRYLSIGEMR